MQSELSGSFKSVLIPQQDDEGLSSAMRKRLAPKDDELEKPLGIFRVNDGEFILCYEGLGLYVTKHGDACRDGDDPETGGKGKVEWTSRAERVAFRANHLFLFGGETGGVEVRHAGTGGFVQTLGLNDESGAQAASGRSRWLWGGCALEDGELYALVGEGLQNRIVRIVDA